MGLLKREDLTANPDYRFVPPLEIEMDICSKYLHCTHEYFTNLGHEEKVKWFLYEEKKRKREEVKEKTHRLHDQAANLSRTTKTAKKIRNVR